MKYRRRGVFLLEMLTVMFMVGVGGTLMALGIVSVLRSQRRVVEFGNRFASTNDFLRCMRHDVRSATSATLSEETGEGTRLELLLGRPPGQVAYLFSKEHVERVAGQAGKGAKLWNPMTAEVSLVNPSDMGRAQGIAVTVNWHRRGANDLDPDRRFDLLLRCGGELGHAED